jgi:hypothetical protein
MSGLVLQTADLDLASDSPGDGRLLIEFGRKFRIRKGSAATTKSAEKSLTPARSFATLRKNAVEFA